MEMVIEKAIELNKCFLFDVTVYLKDTNMFGTSYFSRYFEWQGMVREEYYMKVKDGDKILEAGIKLVTKKAWIEYLKETHVFDKITIMLQNSNIRKYSFDMLFTYFNSTKDIIAIGGQTITFLNKENKLTKIPQQILDLISCHVLYNMRA